MDLYDVLDVDAQLEVSLRTRTTMVKVFRSDNGTTQIVCHLTTNRNDKSKSSDCTIEKSASGRPLPEYVLRRIMG